MNNLDQLLVDCFTKQIETWRARSPTVSFYKELVLPNIYQTPDLSWKRETGSLRKKTEPALLAALKEISDAFFEKNQTVLEIGSGPVVAGSSYLSSLFQSIASYKWSCSDWPATHPAISLNLLDELPWKGERFDRVVGCNVLDTLPYADLSKAFVKLRTLLKQGGLFVHLADINLFTTAFLDACAQTGNVLCPSSNSIDEIYLLPKSLYQSKRPFFLSDKDRQFFETWGGTSPQIQGIILNNAFMTHQDLSSFSNIVHSVFAKHCKPISTKQMFETHLKEAAHQSNWKILECGDRIGEAQVPLLPGALNNYCYSDLFTLDEGWDATIPQGKESLKITTHLFAAKAV